MVIGKKIFLLARVMAVLLSSGVHSSAVADRLPKNPGIEAAFPKLPVIPTPVAMVQPKNDSSFWFILGLDGHVYCIDNNKNAKDLKLVLDISQKVVRESEFGLTGLTFHPDYPTDNRVFMIYNDNPEGDRWGGRSVLSSFRVDITTRTVDQGSEKVLITVYQPGREHNAGDLAFGLDRKLYASFGEGGARREESQTLKNLLGTVIRIDVNEVPYGIPEDNPFHNDQALCSNYKNTRPSIPCPEVFAYGFRNPWRFSIDKKTGDVWVGDVGEETFEEINRIVAGGNYGWPIMEGSTCFEGTPCSKKDLQLPVVEYGRRVGLSVVGGFVYRGTRAPSLYSHYIFGDTISNRFFSVPAGAEQGDKAIPLFNSNGRNIYSMAQGNDGEVYLLNSSANHRGDNIYRVVAD